MHSNICSTGSGYGRKLRGNGWPKLLQDNLGLLETLTLTLSRARERVFCAQNDNWLVGALFS